MWQPWTIAVILTTTLFAQHSAPQLPGVTPPDVLRFINNFFLPSSSFPGPPPSPTIMCRVEQRLTSTATTAETSTQHEYVVSTIIYTISTYHLELILFHRVDLMVWFLTVPRVGSPLLGVMLLFQSSLFNFALHSQEVFFSRRNQTQISAKHRAAGQAVVSVESGDGDKCHCHNNNNSSLEWNEIINILLIRVIWTQHNTTIGRRWAQLSSHNGGLWHILKLRYSCFCNIGVWPQNSSHKICIESTIISGRTLWKFSFHETILLFKVYFLIYILSCNKLFSIAVFLPLVVFLAAKAAQ